MVALFFTYLLVAVITIWWGTAIWMFSDLGEGIEIFSEGDEAEFQQACFDGMRRGIQ